MDVELEPVAYRFRRPVVTAYGTLVAREVLRLRLLDQGETVGVGEAAPLPPYDGVTIDAVREALSPVLAGLPDDRARWPDVTLAHAAAALDTAWLDARARGAGTSVAALHAAQPAQSVAVNATIADTDRAGAARASRAAVDAGFGCVKLKVGVGDDAGRVAAVRAAAGPDVAIRIDANGAWQVAEAVAALRVLAPAGIELCEEPVHGTEALAEVREQLGGEVAIAMDETAHQPGAVGSGACDFVCLKVGACGGITGLWDAARTARAAGSRVYVASAYDGPVGIAAGLQAAAGLGELAPCGLATLALFAAIDDPFPVRDGRLAVPAGPGLGL
jgi:L-alanine-DL-glutamate epimerase-like enolase superfamily enzyme